MFDKLKHFLQSLKSEKQPQGMPTPLMDSNMTVLTGSAPPVMGTTELLKVYSKSPRLRSILNKIAVAVAKTNWRLFAPIGSDGKYIRNPLLQKSMDFEHREKLLTDLLLDESLIEIQNHPLLDLLSDGNSDLLGYTNLQVTQTHIDLCGEGFWLKERNTLGVPIELWPLPPDWIKDLPTRDFPFFKISALNYRSSYINIPATEIIYFKDPDPANPYGRGSGLAKSLGDEIEIDEYSAGYLKSFFYNRARPDIIISGDGLNKDDTLRLEQKWLEKQQGFWNRFKPMFLSKKVDIQTISQDLQSMQITALRKDERDAFISIVGAPPEMFGVLTASNRSTIGASDYFWAKHIICPRMEMLRVHLQKRLVPDFDERLILHYHTPIPSDEEAEFKAMQTFPYAFSINELRGKAMLKNKKDEQGELHPVPVNVELMDLANPVHVKIPKNDDNKSIDMLEQKIYTSLITNLPAIKQAITKQVRRTKHA